MSRVHKAKRKEYDMRKRLTKLGAALAALAALAIGGSALASAAGGGSQPAKAPAVVQQDSAKAGAAANEPVEKADTDAIQDENGKDDATEQAGAEENGAAEQADTDSIQDENGKDDATEQAQSGSEVPGDDGPGGWADEPR